MIPSGRKVAFSPFDQSYAPGPKNWDFNIQQIGYSKKRAQAVDFSDSYYDESEALVAVPLEAVDSTFSTTATAPTAITMPTTMAMIRRDTGRSSSGA